MARKKGSRKRGNRRIEPGEYFAQVLEADIRGRDAVLKLEVEDGTGEPAIITVAHKLHTSIQEKPAAKSGDKINPKHYQKQMRRSSTFDPGVEVILDHVIGEDKKARPWTKARTRQSAGVQTVDVIETFTPTSAHRAHALTYMLRAGEKVEPGETKEEAMIRDLKKAAWWLLREVEYLGGGMNPLVKK